ncbi:hypothetical protein FA15DRAFT_672592 [Coprinopsis marcescibilis]|uniref:RapZ C-terminal domain-containing protein n=1 Tax=Coprinopsis marcescibilis TaxID=230819 RepID=A0A5C3KMY6_COPMA|nr:hypothetical protein FA15DRAFT_672592 [Coprinopsis marcescibilis]
MGDTPLDDESVISPGESQVDDSSAEAGQSRVLKITSFGYRNGRLRPTPALTFDIRILPNPPRHIRASQSGLCKSLQEWLISNPEVQARFESISRTINNRMLAVERGGEVELSVGVCCQVGHHRSVAIVEALGRKKWEGLLDHWDIVVHHRDLQQDNTKTHKDQVRRAERDERLKSQQGDEK